MEKLIVASSSCPSMSHATIMLSISQHEICYESYYIKCIIVESNNLIIIIIKLQLLGLYLFNQTSGLYLVTTTNVFS